MSRPGARGVPSYSYERGDRLYPFDRFSEGAKAVLTFAQQEAELQRHHYIGTEHLLLGLIRNEAGVSGQVLSRLGIELAATRATVTYKVDKTEGMRIGEIIPTPRVKRVIELAFEEARNANSDVVGSGQLLIALLVEGHGIGAQVLNEKDVTVDRVRSEIIRVEESGVKETVVARGAAPTAPMPMRQLDLRDEHGNQITVAIIFPLHYTEQQCSDVAARIQAAFEGPKSQSN